MDINKFLHTLSDKKDVEIPIDQQEIDRQWLAFSSHVQKPTPNNHSFLKGFASAAILGLALWLISLSMSDDQQWVNASQKDNNGTKVVTSKIEVPSVLTNGNVAPSLHDSNASNPASSRNQDGKNMTKEGYDAVKEKEITPLPNSLSNNQSLNNLTNKANNLAQTQLRYDNMTNDVRVSDTKNNYESEPKHLANTITSPTESDLIGDNKINTILPPQKQSPKASETSLERDKTITASLPNWNATNVMPISNSMIYPLSIQIKRVRTPMWFAAIESQWSLDDKQYMQGAQLSIGREILPKLSLVTGLGLGSSGGLLEEQPRKWPNPMSTEPFKHIEYEGHYIVLPLQVRYQFLSYRRFDLFAGPQMSLYSMQISKAKFRFDDHSGVEEEEIKFRPKRQVDAQFGIIGGLQYSLNRRFSITTTGELFFEHHEENKMGRNANINLGLMYYFSRR